MSDDPYRSAPRFYVYDQNNTFGSFDEGTGHQVLVEATSPEEADDRAPAAGVYFDGCVAGRDCPCCGDRWYRAHKHDAVRFERPLSAEFLRARLSEYKRRNVLRVLYADGTQEVYKRCGDDESISKLRPSVDGQRGAVAVELPVAPIDAWTIPGLEDDT